VRRCSKWCHGCRRLETEPHKYQPTHEGSESSDATRLVVGSKSGLESDNDVDGATLQRQGLLLQEDSGTVNEARNVVPFTDSTRTEDIAAERLTFGLVSQSSKGNVNSFGIPETPRVPDQRATLSSFGGEGYW